MLEICFLTRVINGKVVEDGATFNPYRFLVEDFLLVIKPPGTYFNNYCCLLENLSGKKKIEIVGSFNGISITCNLEMKFVFHNSEIIVVCHVYVPQSGLTRPFHVTPDHDTSSERKFRCSLHDLKFT